MKNRILIGLGLLLAIFFSGSLIAAFYITKTTHRMDRLIILHQVEILREDLILRVQQVQSMVYRAKKRSGKDVDLLIDHVQEMDRVMDSCAGCHHSPELAQGLRGMRDLADDYETAISHLFTASAGPERMKKLEQRVEEIGRELISMTQGMAFTANVRMQQKTKETMVAIRQIRGVLYGTLALGFVIALAVAYLLMRSLDRPLQELMTATRQIARGDMSCIVDAGGGWGDEFKELGESFNAMMNNLRISQRQLVQSAKMSTIGDLATNIVYEVNSPLAGVLGHTGLLLNSDDIPVDEKEHLKTIERETLRAREVLGRLLDFARRRPPQLVRADICGIVQDALSLARGRAVPSNVEIVMECPEGLPHVNVDVDEMKQVFVNLINNAISAMPNGGRLTIRSTSGRDAADGRKVITEVIDTGIGIPETHLDRIFDPFFTTGMDAGGTGLGLSISYLILKNHGGHIEVESAQGGGSTFRVALPA